MRKLGLAAFDQHQQNRKHFLQAGGSLAKNEAELLATQLKGLQDAVRKYGSENSKQLAANKDLQSEYSKLCGKLRITPQTPDGLAIRIIEICRATFAENGGVLSLRRLKAIMRAQDGQEVNDRSIEKALQSLRPLGAGMNVETLANGVQVVSSVAHELSTDHGDIIVACDALGYVSETICVANLAWSPERAKRCLEQMVSQGLLWEDAQAQELEYWSLGAFCE